MLSPSFLFLCSLLLFLFPVLGLLLLCFSAFSVSFYLGLVSCFLVSLPLTLCLLYLVSIRVLKQTYVPIPGVYGKIE